MKFKINCIKNNKPAYYIFDNETIDIWNANGVPTMLDKDIRFDEFRPKHQLTNMPIYSKDNPIIGKSNIKTLKLSLGFKCNYKCEYCWQRQFEQAAIDATPALVSSFISKLKQIDLSHADRIDLWGGEPLVYWKTLKLLIPAIKDNFPQLEIMCLSNGSLLTKEIADFLVKYNVSFGISHDAQAFTYYRNKEDPLDTNRENIIYFCKKQYEVNHRAPWFSVTVNKHNLDLDQIYPFFVSKLGKDCPIHIHVDNLLETATEKDYNEFKLTEEEKQFFIKKLVKNLLGVDSPLSFGLSKELKYALFIFANKVTPWQRAYNCDLVNHNVMALNMRGDVLSCHSYPADVCGNINDLEHVSINRFTHWSLRDHCKECPILPICHGGRPCVTNEEQHWLCEQFILWRYPIFIAAWKLLFNADIQSIEKLEGE